MASLHLSLHVDGMEELAELLKSFNAHLGALIAEVKKMNAQVDQIKTDMTELKAEVTKITNVAQSAKAAFEGFSALLAALRQQIADLLANATGLSQEDKDALTSIHDQADQLTTEAGAGAQSIADAIVANPAQ